MDAETIFSKQIMQMEKEKKEKEGKLRAQEKKVHPSTIYNNIPILPFDY